MLGAASDADQGLEAGLHLLVERISKLAGCQEVWAALGSENAEALSHRALEAVATFAAAPGTTVPIEPEVPSLCALAVDCVRVVERAELSTELAQLASAGCEVLAQLLDPRTKGQRAGWCFDWVEDTLEELSDQLDYLAVEVYCGLARLPCRDACEADVVEAHVDTNAFWGSRMHRKALERLSTWLLCVIFRAVGYAALTARVLMEFANQDVLCLCALLRGLFAAQADANKEGLPHDLGVLQGLALQVLCGLTAPELAFPASAVGTEDTEGIEARNQVLAMYLEVLCAAVVETGLLEDAVKVVVAGIQARTVTAESALRFLAFLAALLLQEPPEPESEPAHPALRLKSEAVKLAQLLGALIQDLVAASASPQLMAELCSSCSCLAAALLWERSGDHGQSGDVALRSACSAALATGVQAGLPEGARAPAGLAALAALANNLGELEAYREALQRFAGTLPPSDLDRAKSLLSRTQPRRHLLRGGPGQMLELLGLPADALPPAPPPTVEAAVVNAGAVVEMRPGIRDVLLRAPDGLRCAIDGKLLCDPVVSPGGIVFERSTLAEWLRTHGPTCPITGTPLELESCTRSPELRRQVTAWVRDGSGGRGKQPKSLRP